MTRAKRLLRTWAIVNVLLASLGSSQALAAVPQRPVNLTATSLSSSQLHLTWQQTNLTNVGSFTIRVATDSAFTDGQNLPVEGATTTSYTHQGLTPSTTYWYKIRANGTSSGWSAWSTVASASTAAAPALEGPSISSLFFGLNAWMPYQIGTDIRYGRLEAKLCGGNYDPDTKICSRAEIYESGAKSMRYGGITVNEQYDPGLSPDQYLTMVINLQANGITPILQVPYNPGPFPSPEAAAEAAAQAAALFSYLNITWGKGVQYWTIGNEPEHAYSLTAAQIADAFRAISQAMKEVAVKADLPIVITGPDLSEYNGSLMNALTECPQGGADITGAIPDLVDRRGNPVYYVDILNFHTYPFNGYQSRDAVRNYPSGTFESNLRALEARVNTCNRAHSRTSALKMAVTETNVNWQNPGDVTDDGEIVPGTNNRAGVGAASFLAGQFWAEIMSIGMNKGLEFINFWSAISRDLGYIVHDDATNADIKLPTYYHFQMLAMNFRGVYMPGTLLVNNAPEPNIKAFGSKDTNQIAVMILNQKTQTSLAYTVRLHDTPIVRPNALTIHIVAGVDSEYSNPANALLNPQSTVLLIFDANGVFQNRTVYALDDHARSDLPPTLRLE